MPEDKKQPACTECREKKLRCVPSLENPDVCHRCARLGKDCQIPEAKRRERKARLRGRVEHLEGHYSEILNLLKRNVHNDASPATTSSQQPGPSVSDNQAHSSPRAPSIFSAIVGTDLLPYDECESLISDYRRMARGHTPFVIIPESCHATSLVEERPMLAQAIFIVTSWRHPARQSVLRANYLKELGDKYLVRSDKSLDLLQSLIVYFVWCHWYTVTFSSQPYRLATMIVTMAIELGITQRPMSTSQHEVIVNSTSVLSKSNEIVSSQFWNYEARRAFIAAYVVSTFCSLASRRYRFMPYTQYLEECASSLAADPQYPSDRLLVHVLGSMHLAEQVSCTFDHGSGEKIGELDDDKIQLLVKALDKRGNEWREALPSGSIESGRLYRSYYTGRAYIHEVGLYGVQQGQTPSITRTSIIYECFDSSMKALSSIVELSLDEMADWGVMDWRQLNLVIMLCTKSSIILDSAYASLESSQRADWLAKCLDTLCLQARELHRTAVAGDPQAQEKDHFLKRLATEWHNVKTYYQNCVQRNLPQPQQIPIGLQPAPAIQQGLQTLDFPFDVDPFNDMYWFGLADTTDAAALNTADWPMQ
ncbi:hypothetical protein LTR10_015237 [Elasticomyces elasticus]|uniref:Zn(2)-C6 fungal-type domain-containing protein n=1 Tax=Exophiala sideris TaxID=1016849 RepID=A0ABR0JE81_9EURO|nr:hypothetical protein LTR10_015237 [Elasticomyces elasticus]KAK5032712.1 hypothetical protein LTS07_004122 [Exophiala sideris]KAK5037108.1 hypothetical protein LTR13_004913 [Exophiala sideris]KAK5062236.1 hypothetical protein LTR69_004594 [Exophiala sideris]KAK5182266.1 hypothetical protein LTR44_005277 [Eurotiomycetes sp. CCFEE 6388]